MRLYRASTFIAASSLLSAACLTFPLRAARAWGAEGHAYAAGLAVQCLPENSPLRSYFTINAPWFSSRSSWPDRWRNRPDDAEAARHFLDGERFGVGAQLSRIPHDYKDLVKIRSYEQLRQDGLLPWTVNRQYQLLVSAFREKRWDDVMVHSAYLSHYVADAHVPFHTTENYDGQLSTPSQKGVHSRFETQLLQRRITASALRPAIVAATKDPITATLAATQDSLAQVPALLAADKSAVGKSGGDYDETYWAAFTPLARPVAVARLEAAGRAIAGLLLAAWEAGGKPTPPRTLMTDRLMPYASPLVNRGEIAPPALTSVSDDAIDAARQAIQHIKVPSKLLNRDVDVTVSLPADTTQNPKTRYSVMYLLHGSSGSENDWNNKTGVAAYAQEFGVILVMPDASGGPGDSWYVNSPGGGKYAEFFASELVPAIDKQFRTIAKREGRALIGNSMGGYGAWRIGLDNPSLFVSAASLSGALDIQSGDDAFDELQKAASMLYQIDDKDAALKKWDASDRLMPRITRHLSRRGHRYFGPALYFDIGKDDYLRAGNRRMEQFLLENAVPYEFAEFPGSHEWTYWNEHVRDALQFSARHLLPPIVSP